MREVLFQDLPRQPLGTVEEACLRLGPDWSSVIAEVSQLSVPRSYRCPSQTFLLLLRPLKEQ